MIKRHGLLMCQTCKRLWNRDLNSGLNICRIMTDKRWPQMSINHRDDGCLGLAAVAGEVAAPIGQRRGFAIADKPVVGAHTNQNEPAEPDLEPGPPEVATRGKSKSDSLDRAYLHWVFVNR